MKRSTNSSVLDGPTPVQPRSVPHDELAIDNALAAWGAAEHPELSVILVNLRYLAFVHQTHHWTARGDSFWGDHKLYEALYGTVLEEIDTVAEKAVGLGNEMNVNLMLQLKQLVELSVSTETQQTVPRTSDLARASLAAERRFIKVLSTLMGRMVTTPGVENMLQGIYDAHEKHVYLLKQRCDVPALGL